jgi:plasmid stabilization system protein ParE
MKDDARRYFVRYAPIAETQIDAALLWWGEQRDGAPGLLALEIAEALDRLAELPQVGRRAVLRGHPTARRLLLQRSGYHLYYVVLTAEREVRVVYFRHARRRGLVS